MFNDKNLKKIILVLIGLIILTGALGYFYYKRNVFGQDKLRFEITAPETVKMGEEVEYILRYKNNSDVRLEEMVLIFEYPESAIIIESESLEDEKIKKRGDYRREVEVGELNPGEERTTVFKARLLGEEGDTLDVFSQIRYIPKNLAARFESKREHTVVIESVPLGFDFQIPSTVDPERENSFRLRFSSDVDYPLTDLEVRLSYPEGFRFIRSTPVTDAEKKDVWAWPVLNYGDDGTIDIDGVLQGDPGDAKIFNAVLGIWKNERFIPLKETTKGTSISQSSLLLDMQVNGREEYVADPGELLHYEIFFRNIGEETLENLFLLVDLDENTLNFDQLEPMDGRFQEERGVIIWSYTFDFALQSLKENEDGKVEFWIRAKEDLPTDPEIKVRASMERAEKILLTRINTRLALKQSVIREDSPFEEEGPFPFEKGENSNYTVKIDAKTLFNDVRDATVELTLPKNARVTGETEPEEISISFDSHTRKVVLDIGNLSAKEEKEIFFEVEVESEEDMAEEDVLVSEAEFTAKDRRTEETVSTKSKGVFLSDVLEYYNQ